ncbi:copper amine oxidase N-terminal domain-containing protein [Paenibacillus sp. GCM10012306]|uniref:copper amine oxidase N-terminal domain-containing protein n=1 Tax=Paenibacillus sp. GCM10012306 TaxID=3317342 RepID=UPI0036233313
MKRIMMFLTLALILSFSMSLADRASARIATVHSPVLLQINQYYVTYTAPQSPYLDQNNRLMVPLRSLSDLLAAEVTYDAVNKSAVISRKNYLNETEKNYSLKMNVGVKDIEINGVASRMDTIPVLIQGSMYIPLSVVAKAFHLDTKWDSSHKITRLYEDPGYLPSGVVSDEEHVLGQHSDSFVRPIQSVIQTIDKKGEVPLIKMQLTSQNTGESTVGDNHYLRFYVQDSNFSHFDIYNQAQTKPGATFTAETTNTILAKPLRYILVDACVD